MKKMMTLLALVAFVATLSTASFAKELSGEVTKVKGNKVTVKISKAEAKKIAVGDSVELEVTAKAEAAPAAGNDMLTGC